MIEPDLLMWNRTTKIAPTASASTASVPTASAFRTKLESYLGDKVPLDTSDTTLLICSQVQLMDWNEILDTCDRMRSDKLCFLTCKRRWEELGLDPNYPGLLTPIDVVRYDLPAGMPPEALEEIKTLSPSEQQRIFIRCNEIGRMSCEEVLRCISVYRTATYEKGSDTHKLYNAMCYCACLLRWKALGLDTSYPGLRGECIIS